MFGGWIESKIITAGVTAVLLTAGCREDSPTLPTQETAERVPQILTRTFTLNDGQVSLAALSAEPFGMKYAGYVSASFLIEFEELTGKTTQVMLFTDVEYSNWLADAGGKPIYDSGRVAAGRTTLELSPSGDYVLAVNNLWSVLTPKKVLLRAVLTYTQEF